MTHPDEELERRLRDPWPDTYVPDKTYMAEAADRLAELRQQVADTKKAARMVQESCEIGMAELRRERDELADAIDGDMKRVFEQRAQFLARAHVAERKLAAAEAALEAADGMRIVLGRMKPRSWRDLQDKEQFIGEFDAARKP